MQKKNTDAWKGLLTLIVGCDIAAEQQMFTSHLYVSDQSVIEVAFCSQFSPCPKLVSHVYRLCQEDVSVEAGDGSHCGAWMKDYERQLRLAQGWLEKRQQPQVAPPVRGVVDDEHSINDDHRRAESSSKASRMLSGLWHRVKGTPSAAGLYKAGRAVAPERDDLHASLLPGGHP